MSKLYKDLNIDDEENKSKIKDKTINKVSKEKIELIQVDKIQGKNNIDDLLNSIQN